MSIVEAVRQTKTQFVPPAGAMDACKQSVREGREEPTILNAVRWLSHQWKRKRSEWLARVENHNTLTVEVPKLEAAAQEAQAVAQRAAEFASGALPDAMTLADLRARLREIVPDVPLDKPADLGRACLAAQSIALNLKGKALVAASRASEARGAAQFALYATGDRLIHQQIDSLRARAMNLETRIKERQPILDIDRRIAACREACENLAAGKRPWDGYVHTPGLPEPPTTEQLYRRKRAELDELLEMAGGKDAAVDANEADREQIEQIQRQIAAKMEELLIPDNMNWGD